MYTSLKNLAVICFVLATSFCSVQVVAQIEKITLDNGTISAEITPYIGGRLLSFSLKGQPNYLLLADLSTKNTRPVVNAEANNIFYFGSEIWVGPQSEWWVHQDANPKRAAAKAVWPPDPYLVLAKNTVLAKSKEKLVLRSPKSIVSGVQLVKTFALIAERKNSLKLKVRANNIRKESLAWDIWFNTRVPSDTLVYIPVANAEDVQQKNLEDDKNGPLTYMLRDGFFSLDMLPPPADKVSRKGKLMIQPAQGWMASFQGKQVFIIQFPHQLQSAIHPEQGQIELYNEYNPANLQEGFLELEVHAPYQRLAPKEFMEAEETWTILEYNGAATRDAHLEFLRVHAVELGLE